MPALAGLPGTVSAVVPMLDAPDPDAFGQDPFWVVALKSVLIFLVLVLLTLFNIWAERRVVARMQHRSGPNVHGPFGLLQSLADGVKLAFKEAVLPTKADKVVYLLAPVVATVPAFVAFSVIPFGPEVRIPFTDVVTPLQLTDMPVAVLFILAIASVGIYGIVLGGWSSGSTYSLLGGLRSSAQMISYEIPMGLALITVFLYSGSVGTSGIVQSQDTFWYGLILLPSFVIYMISMVGEVNRAPFDLPEAEGELVGGFHTEYSSLGFALFFLAEYINMVTVSAIATTLFLGGWAAPWPIGQIWAGANEGYWPLLWFFGKILFFMFIFVWLRGTLPRLRYDQFMDFGWKRLIPVALGWLVAVAVVRQISLDGGIDRNWLIAGFAVVAVLLLVLFFFGDVEEGDRRQASGVDGQPDEEPHDGFAGGYPTPPMPAGGAVRGPAAPLTFEQGTRVTTPRGDTDRDEESSLAERRTDG